MSNFLELIRLAGCKEPTDNGNYWRTNAVWRGGEGPSVTIHKETGFWHDFVKGDKGTFQKFCELCGLTNEVINNPERLESEELHRIQYKRYDKNCLKRLKPIFTFYTKRGISEETLQLFSCGLALTGRFYQRMCFPIFDRQGAIIGFAGRKIEEDTPRPKWLIYGPKKEFIYPSQLNDFLIKIKAEVVLVESVGDVLALWEIDIRNALCLFGLNISPKLMAYMLEISPDRIIISTNNDIRGRGGAARIRKKLKKHFPKSKIRTVFPVKKDWADSLDSKLLCKKRIMM